MNRQLQLTFAAALESLSRRDRRLLTLYEIDGVSIDGVSGALGITRNEARVGLFQARRAMRQRLSDQLRVSA